MEKCLAVGATRYLAKPLNFDEVRLTLEKIESYLYIQSSLKRTHSNQPRWIGVSQFSNQIRRRVAELKNEPGTLLIEGESGTGKDVIAKMLHKEKSDRPFISVNMASIPDSLFESEFFGHVRGAFTGATQNKIGLAEAAHNGDLFLDEIEALPLHHQAKLLRFLENGEIRKVGSRQIQHVDTRVIVATNKNLETMVEEKLFREDLLYRINGKKIILSPLRERREDIPILCEHFLKMDSRRPKMISNDAIEVLKNYDWPGNVRELKRACENLQFSAPLPLIRASDVHYLLNTQNRIKTHALNNLDQGLDEMMAQHEVGVIKKCLEQFGNVDEAARVLKVSRSNLYKKIKDLRITWKGFT